MKKHTRLLFLISIMVLLISKNVFAEGQAASPSPTATPTQTPASTVTPTPTATPATNITATPSPDTVSNSVYNSLLSKIDTKNNLVMKENQVCKQIKEQESSNQNKVSAIIEKSKSYSTAFNNIVDDIKLLINTVKEKETLYNKAVTQNKTDAGTISKEEAALYDKQITNLNLAIKAMRESMKYISLENVNYNLKLKAAQKNIDKFNQTVDKLNKEIITDKINKDNEWNNFSQLMVKGDLKAANESYDKILKYKEQIVQNYTEILINKKSIEEQLLSVAPAK